MTVLLTEEDVQALLPMKEAVTVCEEGFRHLGGGLAVNHPRQRIRTKSGAFQMMTAADNDLGIHGFKTYSGGPQSGGMVVLLYRSETGELLAVLKANALGQIRTGAASGVATKYMAHEDAAIVGIIGTEFQAETQLEAVCAVRPIRQARAFSRTEERRETFATKMSDRLGIEVVPVDSGEACVRGADVVITITNAREPVLLGQWLEEGMHINAAGGNHWLRRELDDEAIQRCSLIAVDDLEQAKLECGDLLAAEARGRVWWEQVRPLADVVVGRTLGRPDASAITLFESQGIALEDITAALHVYQKAVEAGRGQPLPGLQ